MQIEINLVKSLLILHFLRFKLNFASNQILSIIDLVKPFISEK